MAKRKRSRALATPHDPSLSSFQNVEAYLESWSEELRSREQRVRNLIGDAHWLSDGHHKEFLIRELLKRYLPRDLIVSRGFVRQIPPRAQCSGELDILVSDPKVQPPLFIEGGLQIVFPDSVVAHIEVKTRATKRFFVESLRASLFTQSLLEDSRSASKTWSGIWFYSASPSSHNILTWIADTLRKVANEDPSTSNSLPKLIPNCIVISDRLAIFLRPIPQSKNVQLRSFEAGRLSGALGLLDFFAHRASHATASFSPTDIDRLVHSLNLTDPTVREVVLNDRNG